MSPIFDGHEGENSYKCNLIRSKLEERLIDRGIKPKSPLSPRIYLRIVQLIRTKELLLEGEEINTEVLRDIRSAIADRYKGGFSFAHLQLLNTRIDNDAIPIIVNRILKPYGVKKLVLDGSSHIDGFGMGQLCNLLKSPSNDLVLTHLSLQHTGITDEEAYKFKILVTDNPNIAEIKLGGNKITEGTVKELKDETLCFKIK